MKYLTIHLLLFTNLLAAQTKLTPILADSLTLKTDLFVGLDQHSNIYHVKDNTLFKIQNDSTINYQNFQLGKINKVDPFNPLKIMCHYRDLNSVVILDNRLAPITTINFNDNLNINNISHVATAFDNNLWLFDENSRELLLYNYQKQKVITKSLPILSEIKQIISNYNNCWVLTRNTILKYNYFAALEHSFPVGENTTFKVFNESILIRDKDGFRFIKNEIQKDFKTPLLKFQDYYLYQDYLYIYTRNYLYKFQLKY